MNDDAGRWITTTEAAQRLGVKRATLYAYVSRGQLRSERRPGQQQSLFDRSEIDALASSTRPASAPQPVLRFRSVATAVSAQRDGDLFYRAVPLAQVATLGLEQAAALVMGDPDAAPSDLPQVSPALAMAIPLLTLERRMPVAVQALACADPFGPDTDPGQIRSTALALVPRAVVLLGGGDAAEPGDLDSPATDRLTRTTMQALGARPGSPAELEVLRVMLVALLDHGLTASTVAARVAASTRAGLHDCLCAAYAAMAGPLHGAAPTAAYGLLAFEGPAKDAVAESSTPRAIREPGSCSTRSPTCRVPTGCDVGWSGWPGSCTTARGGIRTSTWPGRRCCTPCTYRPRPARCSSRSLAASAWPRTSSRSTPSNRYVGAAGKRMLASGEDASGEDASAHRHHAATAGVSCRDR